MLQELCKQVPEIESAAIVINWQPGLQDASIPFIWTNHEGQLNVVDPAPVRAAMDQTLKLAEYQISLIRNYCGKVIAEIAKQRETYVQESDLTQKEKTALLAKLQQPNARDPVDAKKAADSGNGGKSKSGKHS